MILAAYEPDIPQNTGSLIRLSACLGVPLHIIEPCGFPFDDKRLRRVSLDYYDLAQLVRHASWGKFLSHRTGRIVLLTTKASIYHTDYVFDPEDIILVGRESAGVPQPVHDAADARIKIPLAPGARSLNVALAAGMVLAEALRQTNGFPHENG